MKNQEIRIVLPFSYTKGEEGQNGSKIETVYDASQEALEEISNGLEMPEVEPDVRFDCSKIDWEKLKKQKLIFLNMLSDWGESDDENQRKDAQEAEGLLNLIDAIQDHAVDVMGLPEKKVFNLSDD